MKVIHRTNKMVAIVAVAVAAFMGFRLCDAATGKNLRARGGNENEEITHPLLVADSPKTKHQERRALESVTPCPPMGEETPLAVGDVGLTSSAVGTVCLLALSDGVKNFLPVAHR